MRRTFFLILFVAVVGIASLAYERGWVSLPLMEKKEDFERPETREAGKARDTKEPHPTQQTPGIPVVLSPVRQQLIGVRTGVVEKKNLEKVIRAVGKVEYDERRVSHVNLRIEGWIEELYVDFTGRPVKKGEPLFSLYSPDLVSAQEEYLLAIKTRGMVEKTPFPEVIEGADHLIESSKRRLLLWGLTPGQVEQLKREQRPRTYVTIHSPIDGFVMKKTAFKGMFVRPEMTLYEIADLSTIWMHAEVYEYELPFVRVGQEAQATVTSYPGDLFSGKVAYISPVLSPQTRTVRVRLEFPNHDLRLKPEMFGSVEIKTRIGEVVSVPEEAVLDSGLRQIIFVDKGEGRFEPREVTLGVRADHHYEVKEGVAPGERIVVSAHFLIDSESKLMASMESMMGLVGMADVQMRQARMGVMAGMEGMERDREKIPPVQEKRAGNLTISLSTLPERTKMGENTLRVRLTEEGKAVTDALVGVAGKMPAMPTMRGFSVEGGVSSDGLYEVPVDFVMGGEWEVTIRIKRPGQPEVMETFTLVASGE